MAGPPGGIRSRRRLAGATGLLVGLALLAGACTDDGGAGDRTTTSTIPPARTLLRVAVDAWPDCLNPLTCDADGALGEQILHHVLPVAMEVDGSGEYVPSPLLAGTPEVDDGAVFTVTYRLSSAARWSDGRPITSSDFRATWLAVMATPAADQHGYREIIAVDDTDPTIAVVELRRPLADWPELFGGTSSWVLDGDALGEQLDLTGRFRDDLPFSAGPFRLAAWDRDIAVLAADETYWDEARHPEIDQVRIERRESEDDLGSFDLVVLDASVRVDAPDGFDVAVVPTTEIIGVWFDRRTPVLGPKVHRDALAVAFDRTEAATTAAGDDGAPLVTCLGWIPAIGPWCDESDLPEGMFDPDLARFALAAEGWVAGDDGILARGDERFALTVTHDPALAGAEEVAADLAERFADLGIEVSVGEIDATSWRGPRPADRSAGVGVFAFDVGISPQVLDLYGCPEGPPSSVIGWCPETVVALAVQLVDTPQREAMLGLVEQLGDAATGDLAWIPLVQRHREMLVRSGRVTIPQGRPVVAGPLARLYDLEVEDG